jgi:hypothetical protein
MFDNIIWRLKTANAKTQYWTRSLDSVPFTSHPHNIMYLSHLLSLPSGRFPGGYCIHILHVFFVFPGLYVKSAFNLNFTILVTGTFDVLNVFLYISSALEKNAFLYTLKFSYFAFFPKSKKSHFITIRNNWYNARSEIFMEGRYRWSLKRYGVFCCVLVPLSSDLVNPWK